jgi:hypothetical protein
MSWVRSMWVDSGCASCRNWQGEEYPVAHGQVWGWFWDFHVKG